MLNEKICVHCFVSGKVQGVWFRASTKSEAELLGITGWAKNLPDGRVEVMACGAKEKVAQLCEWLKQGPEHARVTDFHFEEMPLHPYRDFDVL